jgi:hypothetical protein
MTRGVWPFLKNILLDTVNDSNTLPRHLLPDTLRTRLRLRLSLLQKSLGICGGLSWEWSQKGDGQQVVVFLSF